ncbi:GNAT family N-acetyltransferase [uncultured Maritalea sp.]|jgi:ribosomal protein S18 acetylase RimI-like enzyme|uniref:GNAT family N-acetyltransferase n=1 Tax=uncultured Maritalea sp. TaxID=757249 RepID=UPI00261598C0|nr:GNAT family N-acetyltransferase [uncultured Maritalea sp.]
MPIQVSIRPTMAEDAAKLKAALLCIWHETYDSFLGTDRVTTLAEGWHTLEKLIAEAQSERICSLVAYDKGQIVGHALMYEPEPRTIHLARLYLDHEYHGQGVGKALLQQAIGAFPHAYKAYLEVYEPNRRAVEFYKGQGFEIVAKTRDAHTDDVLYEYRMEKDLTRHGE